MLRDALDCAHLTSPELVAQLLIWMTVCLVGCLGHSLYVLGSLARARFNWPLTLGQRLMLCLLYAWTLLACWSALIDGLIAFACRR